MRTSKVSQETAKLLGTMAAQSPSPPPRRITRSSLARFAYSTSTSSESQNQKSAKTRAAAPTPSPDIEDVIPDTSRRASTRKRKRTLTLATPASASPTVKTELETTTATTTATTNTTTASKPPKRPRKPARTRTDPATTGTSTTATPPADWEQIYALVKAMREPGGAASDAPVDTMGCERLASPSASARDRRFQTLIALMLSSQTKDTTNALAMSRLQTSLPAPSSSSSSSSSSSHAQAGLTLENVLAADVELINELIRAVGFHNTKARHIKAAALTLRDEWGSDIPDTFAGLTSLPGVGPKMAHLCLSAAWGRTEGIGVDVHVHRITNLWGWHGTKTTTKNPEDTRRALEAWLPRDRWHEINGLLVGLGQTVCRPVGRRCGDCEVGLAGLCRAADRGKVAEGRRRRRMMVKEEEKEAEEVGDAKVEVKEEEEEEEEEEVMVERDTVGS
ncbi:putative DNA repair protein NTG1 [Xylariomycetidae sp. FL2044]|nr:putative DNA repair protein NTG1 [Xylariomycetidae sp. FL2044]